MPPSITHIKEALQLPLPGQTAQYAMAPEGRDLLEPNTIGISLAAVLILLYPLNGLLFTVFIKRPTYNGHHSGQISFPGGKFEATDQNLSSTALRETFEEIGVNAHLIQILGALTPLKIPVSGFEVHPYIGYVDKKPEWFIDKHEVEYIIETPLKTIMQAQTVEHEMWHLHNKMVKVPFFNIKGEKVWGATAMILSEFLQIVKT